MASQRNVKKQGVTAGQYSVDETEASGGSSKPSGEGSVSRGSEQAQGEGEGEKAAVAVAEAQSEQQASSAASADTAASEETQESSVAVEGMRTWQMTNFCKQSRCCIAARQHRAAVFSFSFS
jgi:hypothetical protein